MKAYCLDKPGSIAGLVLRDAPTPIAGAGEILIRIKATSINNRDLMVLNDQYGFPIPAGLIPLSDGAGIVEAVGPKVRRFAVGDRVSPTMQPGWIGGPARPEYFGTDLGGSWPGVLSQYFVVSEEGAVRVPSHLSFEEAATLNCAGVTAWSSLTYPFPVAPGETVLVQGTGGVSLFALQLAKTFGARVIAISSTEEKLARLKTLGADEVINYQTNPDWHEEARRLTGGIGVDRVVETGGPTTLARSIAALRVGGQISLVGFSGGFGESLNPLSLIGRAIRIETISVGSRNDYEAMNRAIEAHGIRPVVDKVFPFADAHAAFEHLTSRGHVGKIVIAVD